MASDFVTLIPPAFDLRSLHASEKLILALLVSNEREDIDYLGISGNGRLEFATLLDDPEWLTNLKQEWSPRNMVLSVVL